MATGFPAVTVLAASTSAAGLSGQNGRFGVQCGVPLADDLCVERVGRMAVERGDSGGEAAAGEEH